MEKWRAGGRTLVLSTFVFTLAIGVGIGPLGAQGTSWQVDPLDLSPQVASRRNQAVDTSGPEGGWNCLEIHVGGYSMAFIIPNDMSGDPERIEQMHMLGKGFVTDVLASNGLMRAAYDAGLLFGFEFDFFPDDPGPKPDESQTLAMLGVLNGEDSQGVYGELARAYCFSAAQFQARLDELTDLMGGVPLAQSKIWLGPVLHASSDGSTALRIGGWGNTALGGLRSGGDVRIIGDSQAMPDDIHHAEALFIRGEGHDLGDPIQAPDIVQEAPPHSALWYQLNANHSFVEDLTIVSDGAGNPVDAATQTPLSGLIHAGGDILIEEDGLTGDLTLVAEEGIYFSGSGCSFTAAVDDMLAWAISEPSRENHVVIDGASNVLVGSIFAPGGRFDVGASNNRVEGTAAALTVQLWGTANLITDGTR